MLAACLRYSDCTNAAERPFLEAAGRKEAHAVNIPGSHKPSKMLQPKRSSTITRKRYEGDVSKIDRCDYHVLHIESPFSRAEGAFFAFIVASGYQPVVCEEYGRVDASR